MKLRLPECFRPVLPLLLLFVSVVSFARQASNGLVMDSVDPASDAKALKQMRAYLNKVRTSQNRPTVALVLSGGGAKGAAEVGALKYMEELGIPVDIIFGTSIGGLLGGLYAVGYDADFLDTLITTVDWEKILSDKVDPAVIPLSEKKFKARYQLSIPFHYSKKTQERILPTENYSHSDAKIKLNKSEDDINTQKGMTAVMSGLPSGYVYGFNVNNLLSSLTVGYHDSISFSKLPIPFYCVATELVSCRERNWTSGELKTAMRSTMSIPGLFSPVRIGDEVLMDGGSQNNFPADIAKAAGADIIIGIDLADAFLTSKQIDNMAKVLLQYTDLPSRRAYETTKEMVDVLIKPDLTGYGMLSFNKAAVDTMIARGRVAAIAVDDQLRSVAERVKGKTTKLHNRPAVNINNTKVRISEVVFDGLSHNDAQVLRRKVNINKDAPLDAAMLERAASIIQATGAVESVTYSLLGTQEPYRLVFECTPAPTHNLGASIRLDTEVWAEIGLNLGLNTNRLSGPKFETDLKLGKSQMIDAVFYLDYPGVPTFNVEASFANMNMRCTPLNEYSFLNSNRIDAGYLTHEEKIYISSDRLLNIDSQLGFRNVGYFWNTGRFSEIPFDSSGNYIGAFLDANYSNFDRQYFPNRGVDVKVGCNIDFYKAGVKTFQPIYAFNVDVRGVIPLGLDNLKLIPDFHCRGVFDAFASSITSPEYSFAHRNCLGGDLAGRYISQQVPFVGFNDMGICYKVDGEDGSGYVSYDHLAVLNLELRVGVIKNLYVSALGGYAHMAPTTGEFFCYRNHRDIFGAALQLAYNTIVGPIKARFSWSDRSPGTKDNFGFYISAGFDF